MILPAAVRHLNELKLAGSRRSSTRPPTSSTTSSQAIYALEEVNADHPEDVDALERAEYMRDTVIPAMAAVREIADKLEQIVADDLWPLPKYSEILFIK